MTEQKAPEGKQGIQLQDLRHEQWRAYTSSTGVIVRIQEPVGINEGPHGHFIVDSQGIHHLVPTGWVSLSWLPKPQEAPAPGLAADEDDTESKD